MGESSLSQSSSSSVRPPFVESARFDGAMAGYEFKLGELGQGYYKSFAEEEGPPLKKKKKTVSFEAAGGVVDVKATLGRLCGMVGKPAKTRKALEMIGTLGRQETKALRENAPLVIKALRQLESTKGLGDLGPLCAPVVEMLLSAENVEESDKADLATWHLSLTIANDLRTDDTYIFAAAMNHVTEALRALAERKNSDERAASKRRDALLQCFAAAWPNYTSSSSSTWAKTPLEIAILLAADNRLSFSSTQRHRLDHLTTLVRASQRRHNLKPRDLLRIPEASVHPMHQVGQRGY